MPYIIADYDNFMHQFRRIGRGDYFSPGGFDALWRKLVEDEILTGSHVRVDALTLMGQHDELSYEDLVERYSMPKDEPSPADWAVSNRLTNWAADTGVGIIMEV